MDGTPDTITPPADPPRPRRGLKFIIQALGFIVGLALLWWCISKAFGGEDSRQSLERLRDASTGQIAALLAFSLGTLIANGLVFHQTIRPVRKIDALDTISINAIATFLNYLPFKLSVIFRVTTHSKRDRLPLLLIGAWMAAIAAILLTVLGTITLTAFLTRHAEPLVRLAVGVGFLAIFGTAVVLVARYFAGVRGLDRLAALARATRLGFAEKIVRSEHFAQIHACTAMLMSPATVAGTIALRVIDIALQAARYTTAAQILGEPLSYADAFVLASAGFFAGIISPSGQLGTREGAIVFLAATLGVGGAKEFARVALLVTATEAIAFLVGAGLGIARLGPNRLFQPRAVTR